MDRQVQPTGTGVPVSPGDMRALSDCQKSYSLRRTGISCKQHEHMKYLISCVAEMKKLAASKDPAMCRKLAEFADRSFQDAWYPCKSERMAVKELDSKQICRMARYLEQKSVVSVDVPFEKMLNAPFCYRGTTIHSIRGRIDMVLEKADGVQTAVIVKYKAPSESFRARNPQNLPQHAIDLLTAYIGCQSIFGKEPYRVELWHLRNRDDQGMNVIDRFEHREGKNIITYDYAGCSPGQMQELFHTAFAFPEKKECSKCIYSDLCNIDREVRIGGTLSAKKREIGKLTLTRDQEEVVNHVNGAMCVVAVPGAGKTASLVQRVIHLVKEIHVNPARILLVTFTRKAAKEMEERIDLALDESGIRARPVIRTYHALGYSVLKENPMYVGHRIRLAEDMDRYALIYHAMQETEPAKNLSYLNPNGEYGIIRFFDRMIDEIHELGGTAWREKYGERYDVDAIWQLYEAYERAYEQGGFIGYDDQIAMVAGLFEQYPSLARKYAEKYEFIMVDEFQDSSAEQVEMLYAVARHHGNLVVVGDDDQSIYAFRGGNSKYMLDFGDDFSGARIVYMEDNFRSNEQILNLCNSLIADNGRRYKKTLRAHTRMPAQKPVYVKDADASYVAGLVGSMLQQGCQPGQIAVLARSNKKLEECQSFLEGTCNVSSPKDYLIKDPVFCAIFDVLTLYFKGLHEDEALYRVFRLFHREQHLQKQNRSVSFYQDLANRGLLPGEGILEGTLTEFCANTYTPVFHFLVQMFEQIKNGQLKEILLFIVRMVFHLESHLVVDDLVDIAEDRGIVHVEKLYRFMEEMMIYRTAERVGYDVDSDTVTLLTAHDAKGKEFPVVILYGMEDFSEEPEEVRVLYVALSRAKTRLFLIETAYNRSVLFDRIAPYVCVQGRNDQKAVMEW